MTSRGNNSDYEIRELRADESDEFVNLMEISFKNSIEEDRLDQDEVRKLMKKIRTPVYKALTRAIGMRMEFYVAEVENTIASGILLNIEKDEVYVGDLMTHPNFRRRGLARELLHLSFKRAHELGKKKVGLGARANNDNAVNLYKSEGFETTYHFSRFKLDFTMESLQNTANNLVIQEISNIPFQDINPMLEDCYPAIYLELVGREKFVKDYIPSRIIRFFVGRVGGQSINTYAFYLNGEEKPRGYIQASQSRVEERIILSAPILLQKENGLLLEAIPKIIGMEAKVRGLTSASIACSMHRTDAITKIESLGFTKFRESISMIKQL